MCKNNFSYFVLKEDHQVESTRKNAFHIKNQELTVFIKFNLNTVRHYIFLLHKRFCTTANFPYIVENFRNVCLKKYRDIMQLSKPLVPI